MGFLALGQFLEELQALLDQVLADGLKDIFPLEHFTGNVKGEIFRVDDTLHLNINKHSRGGCLDFFTGGGGKRTGRIRRDP